MGNSTFYLSFSAEINQNTTEALLKAFEDIIKGGYKEAYLLFSTPGGAVTNGVTIYNVLKSLPIKLFTHNVSTVDSIGNVIFLAGQERYACPSSSFMFHGVGLSINQPTRFELKDLNEKTQSVESDNNKISQIISQNSNLSI